jgi:putative chromate ion transporter
VPTLRTSRVSLSVLPFAAIGGGILTTASFSLISLFLLFLKLGATVFGSGYVLLAFLRADLVTHRGWLTDAQLVDAVAVGQVTPGPVFTTATFIGFIVGGIRGAVVATVGIFLPAFLLVAASGPLVPRIRKSRIAGAFLDSVNVASLALMAAVSWQLGRVSLVDTATVLLAAASLIALVRFRVNSAWLVLFGGDYWRDGECTSSTIAGFICLLVEIHHSNFVHATACQVQPSIGSGNHVANHTTAGWDRLGTEALRFGTEPDQSVRVHS